MKKKNSILNKIEDFFFLYDSAIYYFLYSALFLIFAFAGLSPKIWTDVKIMYLYLAGVFGTVFINFWQVLNTIHEIKKLKDQITELEQKQENK